MILRVTRRAGRAILSALTEPAERPYLLADFDEEADAIRQRRGSFAAVRWILSEVFWSTWPLLRRRWSRAGSVPAQSHSTGTAMDHLLQDTRYALRALRKRPGFTVVAALTLSIAIGANTAIFSVINGVFFKNVPGLTDVDGLVEISRDVDGRFFDMAYPVLTHWRETSTTMSDIVAMNPVPLSLGGEGEPDVQMGMVVTGNYFTALSLSPLRGRFFAADEAFYPRVANVMVISERLWVQRYASASDVVGRVVRVNGIPMEIIGVAPSGFHGHSVGLQFDVWVPIGAPVPGLPGEGLDHPFSAMLGAFGRLQDGASAGEAAAELGLLAGQFLAEQDGDFDATSYTARVDDWKPVPAIIRAGVTAFFVVIMTVVGLVLTMACTNVANMILARSTERRREIAVRLAMGANRRRIVRQLLTEALVLFMGAGVIGLTLAGWGTALLLRFQPPLPPGFLVQLDLAPDARVVVFSLLVSIVAGLLFSLAPALRATRPELVSALKDDPGAASPTRTRLRSLMVGAQMAATIVLLIAAGLFVRSLASMEHLDPGWHADNVTTMAFDVELVGMERAGAEELFAQVLDRTRAIPGVHDAAFAAKLPLAGCSSFGDLNAVGVTPPPNRFGFDACLNRVSPGYFATLGLNLTNGRDFTSADLNESDNAAIINELLAQRLWPGQNPVGRTFFAGSVESGTPFQVVGVVENAKYRRLTEAPRHFYYVPARQFYSAQMTLHVQSDLDVTALAPTLRAVVRDLHDDLPLQPVMSLNEGLQMFFLPQRLGAWIAGVMGLAGVLLGAVGVYGVTAFAIGQRTREIGLRLALGAEPRDVIHMAMRQGLRAPLVGMLIGLGLALVLSRFLGAFLALVSPVDPLTFGGVTLGLGIVAAGATFLPAQRAARLDPASTLRGE